MSDWLVTHLPHLAPPVMAFLALIRMGVWASEQPPSHYTDEEVAAWNAVMARKRAARRRPVRRGVARAGVLALTPLVAAVVTGLFIYTWNLRGDRPSAALVWVHVVTSSVGLALASGKVLLVGRRRLAAGVSLRRAHEALSSLVLLGLGVPLLLTGVWLLLRPSGSSTTDYVHLIVSVWWTLLLQWHLWRYLGRALGATFRGTPRAAAAAGGGAAAGGDAATTVPVAVDEGVVATGVPAVVDEGVAAGRDGGARPGATTSV